VLVSLPMYLVHLPNRDRVTADRQSARRREGSSLAQPQQSAQETVFDLPKVLAVGIVSPAAAVVTSRFGITGTLLGLFLSSVFITAGVDLLKVYLARVPGAVTTIPGGFRRKSSLRNVFDKMKRPFSKFASLPRARRRSLLVGSLAAAAISFVVGLVLITVLEVGVGKNLSCWVWDDCSTETSADGSSAAQASTLPTVLGGVQSASSNTPEVVSPSSSPQQQQPGSSGTPGAPSWDPNVPGSETPKPSPSAQPGQRQGPSGIMDEGQQQIPSGSTPAEPQPSSADNSEGSEGY
jgi:hypothetical protein